MFKIFLPILFLFAFEASALTCIATRESDEHPLDVEMKMFMFDGTPQYEARMDNAYFLATDFSKTSGKIRIMISGKDNPSEPQPKNCMFVHLPFPTKEDPQFVFFEYNNNAYTVECKK